MRFALTIARRLLEADEPDAFDIKQDLLRERLCGLCGLPLTFPPQKPMERAVDPFDEPVDAEDDAEGWPFGREEPAPAPEPEPDDHVQCRAMVYHPENSWRSVHTQQGDLKAAFMRVAHAPDKRMYHDSRFWDGEKNAVLYTRPDQWRTIHDVSRAAFFARKHSQHGSNHRALEGFDDLARHIQQKGIRLHPSYVLELGIMLTRLGADSYTILKPFMDIAA